MKFEMNPFWSLHMELIMWKPLWFITVSRRDARSRKPGSRGESGRLFSTSREQLEQGATLQGRHCGDWMRRLRRTTKSCARAAAAAAFGRPKANASVFKATAATSWPVWLGSVAAVVFLDSTYATSKKVRYYYVSFYSTSILTVLLYFGTYAYLFYYA